MCEAAIQRDTGPISRGRRLCDVPAGTMGQSNDLKKEQADESPHPLASFFLFKSDRIID
jgi:hypothetical protein